jgi:cytochrome P450
METQAIFKQHEDELTRTQTAVAGLPLERFDVANRDLYATDTILPYFERLRRESPIHYCPESEDGPFWSITRYDDIKQIELDWQHFSSEPSIVLFQARDENDQLIDDTIERVPSFIAMDPPKHTAQRKAVRPAVAPKAVRTMEDTIRERAAKLFAGGRGLRLGPKRLHRTHDTDAGDVVRIPVRGA